MTRTSTQDCGLSGHGITSLISRVARRAYAAMTAAVIFAIPGYAFAQATNYFVTVATVDYVGAFAWPAQYGSAFVHIVESLPFACSGPALLYFNYNTAEGRTYMNIFLTAKATGTKVYINFQNTSGNPDCVVVQARLGP